MRTNAFVYVMVGLIGILLVSMFSIVSTPTMAKVAIAGNTLSNYHGPIFILNDNDFTPENGVIGGSGTKDDPYVIANWIIKANGTAPYNLGTVAIFVANTTKYFVIRNVTIFGGDWGILIENTSNFVVENSKFYDINNYAIVAGVITKAENGIIRYNEGWNIDSFLSVGGTNFTIENNHLHNLEARSGGTFGIVIIANETIVKENLIEDINGKQGTYADGILVLSPSTNITIHNNTIRDIYNITFGEGIVLYTLNGAISRVNIESNEISNVADNGISIDAHNGGKIDYVNITNNKISGCYWRSILVYHTYGNITIANNILFNNTHRGVGVEHSSLVTIESNEVSGNGEKGIDILNSTDIRIIDNNVYENRNEWPIAVAMSSKVIVSGNDVENSKAGILSYNSTNVLVSGNIVKDITEWPGIETLLGSGNITILNNDISNVNSDAISVHDLSDVNVIGNSIMDSNSQGIHIYNAKKILIKNNSIRNVSLDGVLVGHNSYNITVQLNNISCNGGGLALISSSKLNLVDNYIYDNGFSINWSGIYLWNAINVKIIRNKVWHNAFAGIMLNNNSNASIINTEIFNNTLASGIEIYYGSRAIIINTTVYNNAHAGIWVIHPGTFAWIENSTVYGNSWRGVEFHEGGYGIVGSSRIFNNSIDGIYILNTTNVTIIDSNISNNGAGGLAADHSSDIRIVMSKFQGNNGTGVKLVSVHDFTVTGSIIEGKADSPPIAVENSDNGLIYLNDIHIGESVIYTKNSSVSWSSLNSVIYVYEEHIFSNYLGNYWDNYIGADSDKDGIGDVPYQINQDNVDEHPLIRPIEDYDLTEVLPVCLGIYNQTITSSGKVFFVFNNLGTPDAYSTSQYVSRTVPIYVRTLTWRKEDINFSKIEEGDVIISVGGPLVNPITAAYDNISQVHMHINEGQIVIITPSGNVSWIIPKPWWNVTEGYFVIQAFHDEAFNISVFTIYGTDADSTAAGAYYFMTKIYPNLGNYNNTKYIVGKWVDTEHGADIPLPGYTQGDTSGFSAGDSIEIVFQG